jgi:hypothetical protein
MQRGRRGVRDLVVDVYHEIGVQWRYSKRQWCPLLKQQCLDTCIPGSQLLHRQHQGFLLVNGYEWDVQYLDSSVVFALLFRKAFSDLPPCGSASGTGRMCFRVIAWCDFRIGYMTPRPGQARQPSGDPAASFHWPSLPRSERLLRG